MLCKVTLKNHASTGSTHMAFLRSIQQIATAAANTTPTCVVTRGGTGTTQNSYDTITVIDNTTAGGWTINNAASNMPTEADNAILGSNSYPYVTLYTDSGKTGTYNTSYITFSSSQDENDNATDYEENIGVQWGIGTVAQSYPSYTSNNSYRSTNIFNSTYYTSMRKGALPIHTNNSDPQHSIFALDYGNGGSSDTSNQSIFYVSATSEWIIIAREGYVSSSQDSILTATNPSGGFFYWGMRENQSWEDDFDFPYWVCVYKLGSDRNVAITEGYWTWMKEKSYTGTTGNRLYCQGITRNDTSTYDFGPVTYQTNINQRANGEYKGGSYATGYKYDSTKSTSSIRLQTVGTANWASGNYRRSGNALVEPLMSTAHQDIWYSTRVMETNAIVDSSTNIWLPPAIPIVISAHRALNAGGKLKGMYHGMQITNYSYLDTVRIAEGLYNINGQYFMPFSYGSNNSSTSTAYGQNISWISV